VELDAPPTAFYSYSDMTSRVVRQKGTQGSKQLPDNKMFYDKTPLPQVLELRFKPGLKDPYRAGTIFAGVLFPVGSITVTTPSLHLESALRHELLQKSTQVASTQKREATEISMDRLSLTVWDLLITRKISCTLRVSLTRPEHTDGARIQVFDVQHSAYTPYALRKELSFYLRECFDLLAQTISSGIKQDKLIKSYR
jgi:hypothetical protein